MIDGRFYFNYLRSGSRGRRVGESLHEMICLRGEFQHWAYALDAGSDGRNAKAQVND